MAELIVICIDNSRRMQPGSAIFRAQCDAIRFYCRAKFQANPDTRVGLFTMSSFDSRHLLYPPTGSLQEIVAKFPRINPGCGEVNLLKALGFGRVPLVEHLNQRYEKKRMVLFVGCRTNLCHGYAKDYGKIFKDTGVAVDVITFDLGESLKHTMCDYRFGWRELEKFVDTCNGNGNDTSHIVHLRRKSCIRDILSKSILKQTHEEENVNDKRRVGGEESSAVTWGIEFGQHVTLSKGKTVEA